MAQGNGNINPIFAAINAVVNTNNALSSNIAFFTLEQCKIAIVQCEQIEETCVCGACVMCTRATVESVPVHILKGNNKVELCGLAELNKGDIIMDNPFMGCRKTDDKQCNVTKEDIEGGEWQSVDRTRNQGENKETLKSQSSYMICTKGSGIIYFADAGQKIKLFLILMTREIEKGELNLQEYIRIKLLAEKWNIDGESVRWTIGDFLDWQINEDKDQFIHNKKIEFIAQYKDVIKDAAEEYDLPEILIAGIVYNEYAGDPMIVDDLGYIGRSIDWSGPDWVDNNLTILKNPDLTSFGNVSIQVRRAWESLGFEEAQVSSTLKREIISSLKDPVENIYISAKHISDLRDMQYPDKSATELTEDELKVIATRYNRGPDLSLEAIMSNTSYGNRIFTNKKDIENALE